MRRISFTVSASRVMKHTPAVRRVAKLPPKSKYVKLQRYLTRLKRSLRKATQWVVFEPNNESVWARVRSIIEDLLLQEWNKGSLVGIKPNQAFFVRCDRTTMTQSDLDNGRLICLIGVAVIKPAEFVIFRVGQWTADRKP